MKRFEVSHNSVGFISETLRDIGKKLGNNLNIKQVDGFTFSIASDEVFAKRQTILITVDPISFLILKIELSDDRSQKSWVAHFQAIKEQNISFTQITNDEGTGMKAAVNSELGEIDRQSDTFHAVAHRLGLYVYRFYKRAYHLLEEEEKFANKFYKAKTEAQKNKYFEKIVDLNKAIDSAVNNSERKNKITS